MFYKIIFIFSMMIGSLISISSSTWMGMWMGLEINLLSIIPLMNNKTNKYSSEASMKYFITQTLASTILMFSIIIMSKNFTLIWLNNPQLMIFNSALMTKMGAAPLHFWFPEVMEGLSWLNCFILLTWQKLAPMVLLMYNLYYPKFLLFFILASMMISGIMGLNQISLRKIMAYSSINHIGWMISSMFMTNTIWIYYFLIYSMISISLISILKMLNIFFIKQLVSISSKKMILTKMVFILNLMSLGGLPPFLGFMPKWLTIQYLIFTNNLFIAFTMIMFTLMTLFYYIRITYPILMFNSSELNFFTKNSLNGFLLASNNSLSIMGLILCTSFFNYL